MKKILLIIFSLLVLLAIPATVFLTKQRQELRQKAAPATTLSILPGNITKRTGDTFSVEIQIDTADNQVVVAELHLSFDPQILSAQSIINGPLFPNVRASGVVEPGSASITVMANDVASPVKGVGVAAVVTFKALAPTTVPISIKLDPSTFVGALGEESSNVLVGTTPSLVTILSGTGQTAASPSPSPTSRPTSTGSITPAITATPGPSTTISTQQSTSSATLKIISPVTDNTTLPQKPTFSGKAAAGTTVTLTIYSDPLTVTLVADANGNWSYTPVDPLTVGPHNIVASARDPNTGATQTATTSFVVTSANQGASSATPVSGDNQTTIIMLIIGAVFLITGMALPMVAKSRLT